MNACTIVAKNYAAHARVLARSFAEHHPDGRFTVLVLDDYEGYLDPATEPFEVITPFEIGLDEFEVMAGTYDVLELSTAVKPWLLRTLLDRGDHVIYLDPDIRVFAPLDDVATLARDHGMVLTPHNVAAMPRDGKKPSETDILIAGAYNLGFIALGDGAPTHEFLDWWAERLRTDCIVDTTRGYFVDQRWIDLVPGMVPNVHLLRDPGYNVAYWNLWSRVVDGRNGTRTVNGSELRFFHFSGYDPRNPQLLSKHQDRIDLLAAPEVKALCDAYGEALDAAGFRECVQWPYTYAKTDGGIELDRAARRVYADAIKHDELSRPVFAPEGEAAFVEVARAPIGGDANPGITRYLRELHAIRADLRAAYPGFEGDSGMYLARWGVEDGPQQHPGTALLMSPAEAAPSAALPQEPAVAARDRGAVDPSAPAGVNLVGYLSAELGVGEVARQVVGALDVAGVPVWPMKQIATASRQGHDFTAGADLENPFAVNLLCVNADQTPNVAAQAGPGFFAGRHTIGWWWWEVQAFPEELHGAFDHVDELWVGSHFVADALAPVSPVPVVRIPLPVAVPPPAAVGRAALGLPEGAFLYLFAFDFNSVFDRKNPLDLVAAYTRAYPEVQEDARLVLKAINGDRHPEDFARLREAIAGRPDILLLDRYLTVAEKDSLTAACDCYVSLHRSEGFGIGMAEASLLGKPVIATGYGGNVDFMAPAGGYLVRHELVPIGAGNAPYPADGVWAQPDLDHAAQLLRAVREEPDEAQRRADAGRRWLLEHHSSAAAGAAMARRLEQVLADRRAPSEALAVAVRRAHDATVRGPAPWPHRRRSAKKVLRALALRAAKPALTHLREVARDLLAAQEAQARAVRAAAAMAEARALSRQRATASWQRAAEASIEGLQSFAERADPVLRRADDLVEAAAAEPYMSSDALRVRGGVLAFEGPDPGGYRAFEDLFRGDEAMIRERQRRAYVPLLEDAAPVFDAGCGRGEMLEVLRDAGIDAQGVDLDAELVDHCRAKGLDAEVGDAIASLERRAEGSLGAVFSAQVVEHLPEDVLRRFVAAAHRALRPGGRLIMETVNPHSPRALKAFWVDPTHEHPLFPEVLLQMARASGFGSGYAFCPNGEGDWERDRRVQGEYAVVATR